MQVHSFAAAVQSQMRMPPSVVDLPCFVPAALVNGMNATTAVPQITAHSSPLPSHLRSPLIRIFVSFPNPGLAPRKRSTSHGGLTSVGCIYN
jgi:hypothetical protein